jgi:hypothetical protein
LTPLGGISSIIGNDRVPKIIPIFLRIDIRFDLGLISVSVIQISVISNLVLAIGSPTKQVLKIQFDKAILRTG